MNKEYTVLFKAAGKFTTVKVIATNKTLAIAKASIRLHELFNEDFYNNITEVTIE